MNITIIGETPIIQIGTEKIESGFAHILFDGVVDSTPVTLRKNGQKKTDKTYTVVDGAIHPCLGTGSYSLKVLDKVVRFRVYDGGDGLFIESIKEADKMLDDLVRIASSLEKRLAEIEKRMNDAEGYDA